MFGQETKPSADFSGQLKKFKADYLKGILDGNPEMIRGYLAEDFRLMPEFQKTIKGRQNSLLYFKLFAERFETQSLSRNEIEVLDLGTRIVETGIFLTKVKLKAGDKHYELKGKYVDVWEKKGKQLFLLTQSWNYDHPVDFAEELRFKEVPSTIVAYEAHVPVNNPISFELAALNKFMETIISERDSKIWTQFYTDDAMWLYTGHEVIRGRESLDSFFKKHAEELPIFEKLDVRNDRIDSSGIYTIEYASHIAVIRNGDFSGVFTGKDLVIWKRLPDGSLKIFRHIGTYD